jgi:hypothetical protein
MIDFSKEKDGVLRIDPDLVSYNCMLSTIARRRKDKDSLKKAEYWMEELLRESGKSKKSMRPNRITYMALFTVIASSSISGKADRARFWLDQGVDKALMNDSVLLQKIRDMERVEA